METRSIRNQPGEFASGHVVAGRFAIDRVLGQGAMATVYRARHLTLDSWVALKVLHDDLAENEHAVTRFLEEARALAALKSENVARVLDSARCADGTVYLALEFVMGQDLEQELRERPRLPVVTAVRYALDVCAALSEAHGRGIVHRDLKPENLLIERCFDGRERIKVIDFGVAKRLYVHRRTLTLATSPVGTPSYMAPEQIANSAEVDGRADIFSLGVVLYEMLTGFLPFAGHTPYETYAATLHAEPTPPSELVPELDPALEAIVLRCLRKTAVERYSDSAELAAALEPFAELPERASARRSSGTIPTRAEAGWGGASERPAESAPLPLPSGESTTRSTGAPVHTTLLSLGTSSRPSRRGWGGIALVAAVAFAGLAWFGKDQLNALDAGLERGRSLVVSAAAGPELARSPENPPRGAPRPILLHFSLPAMSASSLDDEVPLTGPEPRWKRVRVGLDEEESEWEEPLEEEASESEEPDLPEPKMAAPPSEVVSGEAPRIAEVMAERLPAPTE